MECCAVRIKMRFLEGNSGSITCCFRDCLSDHVTLRRSVACWMNLPNISASFCFRQTARRRRLTKQAFIRRRLTCFYCLYNSPINVFLVHFRAYSVSFKSSNQRECTTHFFQQHKFHIRVFTWIWILWFLEFINFQRGLNRSNVLTAAKTRIQGWIYHDSVFLARNKVSTRSKHYHKGSSRLCSVLCYRTM